MSESAKLHVPDISCQHCAMTIKRELAPVQGIVAVEVDVANKTVSLVGEGEDALARAKAVLEDIGYPASND